jgi:hypothetical protein
MPDAKVMAGINVQRAKTSAFGQFLLMQMPAGDSLDGFISATGFDPRQDLVEILMASNTTQGKSQGLILARGTFNPAQIAAALAKDTKHTAQIYNGAELITPTASGDGGAVAFLSTGIAIAGDLASVKSAIDRSGANNAIDPGLAAKVASYAASDAWSVSISPISLGDAKDNPIAGALKNVQQASAGVILSSPVQISADALASTDQDATSLSDVLKFVVMMVMQGNAQATLLNTLNIATDHSTVKVSLSIPEDQLEQIIKSAKPAEGKQHKKPLAAHV